jgi:putative Mn2+ efflux pump MntP
MSFLEIIIIAFGLAMDAFAVSVASGVALNKVKPVYALRFGVYCGIFQFIMPLIGWLIGTTFADYITAIDHWVAFILLVFIGGNMLLEAFKKKKEDCEIKSDETILGWKNMTLLAVATSIDALAVGVGFAVMGAHIWLSASIIGLIAFGMAYIGVMLGKKLGCIFKKRAEIVGGLILIGIGLKILIEHLIAG